jgi:hypothetical protein
MGLLVGPLRAVIARYSSVIIELDPLCLLVEAVTDRDVEVQDFPVVELITSRGLIETRLVVEDTLLEVVDAILVSLVIDAGRGLAVGNGLKEAVGNAPE